MTAVAPNWWWCGGGNNYKEDEEERIFLFTKDAQFDTFYALIGCGACNVSPNQIWKG